MMRIADARVALVHHWLLTMRGGERVLEAMAEIFPLADIFTLVCEKSRLTDKLKSRRISTSFLQYFPGSTRWYGYYLPLFPLASGRMNLSNYDIVISSDAATVKGVRSPGAIHICYCHTPMRYVWHEYDAYKRAAGAFGGAALHLIRDSLCRWDYEAAQRVTSFVANSRSVQSRIRECYGRESSVIYPPVDTERFDIGSQPQPAEEYFLLVSQLVPYKRVDLVVETFNRSRRPLRIIGDGPERQRLEALAGPTVRFLGAQPDERVIEAMRGCRAFVFAGEEDFGIVIAEAQACGKPVIALGRGGAPEIVTPNVTGILFEEPTADSMLEALNRFDRQVFDPFQIRNSVLRFSRERFLKEFLELIELQLSSRQGAGPESRRVAV